MRRTLAAAVMLTLMLAAARAQDTAAGQQLFALKCGVCHSLAPGKRSVGPSLIGVVGRKAGVGDPDFSYSDAMKNSGKVWNKPTLDAFLTKPRSYIPGIKMLFAGLPAAQDRADLIAYLATLR